MHDPAPEDAYSMPQIAPMYPEGPYEYRDSRAFVTTYPIAEDLAEASLPTPLSVPDTPRCSVWFYHYPMTSGFGTYNEFILGLTAEHDGDPLMYVLYEGLDSDVPTAAGREIHGTGKKMGEVILEERGNAVVGEYSRQDTTVATGSMELEAFTDSHPMTREESRLAYWKRIPSATKGAPPAVDRVTVSKTTQMEAHWAMTGPAEVSFEKSAPDYLYPYRPESDRLRGYYIEADFVLENADEGVLHTFEEYAP